MWYDHTEARREMFEDPDDGQEFSRRQLLDAQRDADAEELELIGLEEHLRDEGAHADYMREAYGDPCPGCGQLRYGGDCGKCYQEEEN